MPIDSNASKTKVKVPNRTQRVHLRTGDTSTETIISLEELAPRRKAQSRSLMEEDAKRKILDDFEAAKTLAEQWRNIHQEIARYCQPSNSNFNNIEDRNTGENNFAKIYTSEGINLVKRASDYIISRAMPKGVHWWDLTTTRAFNTDKAISSDEKRQLDMEIKREAGKMRSLIERSNFRQTMRRSARDFLTFGISATYVRSFPGNLAAGIPPSFHFESLPIGTYYLAPSPSADRVGVYWERKWTIAGWKRTYPNFPLPDPYNEKVNEQQDLIVAMGITPLADGSYLYNVFLPDNRQFLHSQVLTHSPIILSRQIAAAGETYPSASFGFAALPTLQSLNAMEFNHLRALALAINPPLLVTNGVEQTAAILLEPGARFLVNNNVGSHNPDVAQLQTQDRTASSVNSMDRMKQSLLETVAINPSLPKSGTPPSATEILRAEAQERNNLSGFADDFLELCLVPMLKTCLQEAKALGIVSSAVTDGDGRYHLNVIGDSEETEKRNRTVKMQALLELMTGYANSGPVTGEKINLDRFTDMVADSVGMTELINTEEEELLIQQEKQRVREQLLAQQAAQGGAPQQ